MSPPPEGTQASANLRRLGSGSVELRRQPSGSHLLVGANGIGTLDEEGRCLILQVGVDKRMWEVLLNLPDTHPINRTSR